MSRFPCPDSFAAETTLPIGGRLCSFLVQPSGCRVGCIDLDTGKHLAQKKKLERNQAFLKFGAKLLAHFAGVFAFPDAQLLLLFRGQMVLDAGECFQLQSFQLPFRRLQLVHLSQDRFLIYSRGTGNPDKLLHFALNSFLQFLETRLDLRHVFTKFLMQLLSEPDVLACRVHQIRREITFRDDINRRGSSCMKLPPAV